MHEAGDAIGDLAAGSPAASSCLRSLEVEPQEDCDLSALQVAYITNQYPKVSHSFIRREILALEQRGATVDRIAIRGWDADVVDPADIAELGRTRYVLKDGLLPLLAATLRTAITRPRQFGGALAAALAMSRNSERSLPYHLVYLAQACRILYWLRDSGARHVHAHFGTNPAEVAMLTRLLGGPPYSYTAHGPEETDRGAFLGIDHKVRHAKFVAAISSHTRGQILRRVGLEDWDKIKVVHCGLDATFLDLPAASRPTQQQLVCVARLDAEKGQMVLLDAMRQVRKRHPDCRLVLVGDGPMRAGIEDCIEEYGLGGHVRITGWLTAAQVRDEILAARALVLPSFQEGLPVVIMEAMALRRPVIATYVAGIPELVRDGIDGWLVPAGDVDRLVASMIACLEKPISDLQFMGERAHARVSARHAIDREVLKLGALFMEELRSGGERS
jgi:colanic acid/amylovoran biosynthesis glycosyltransferase